MHVDVPYVRAGRLVARSSLCMFERYWHFPAAAALLLIVPVALLLPSTANAFSFHLGVSNAWQQNIIIEE